MTDKDYELDPAFAPVSFLRIVHLGSGVYRADRWMVWYDNDDSLSIDSAYCGKHGKRWWTAERKGKLGLASLLNRLQINPRSKFGQQRLNRKIKKHNELRAAR